MRARVAQWIHVHWHRISPPHLLVRVLMSPRSYTFITILQLIAGLGSKVHHVQKLYFVSAMGYGVVMLFALCLSAWHLIVGRFSTTILIASAGAFASYALSAFIHGELPGTVAVFLQYMFMLPTFVNMFTIYSFCNMHVRAVV